MRPATLGYALRVGGGAALVLAIAAVALSGRSGRAGATVGGDALLGEAPVDVLVVGDLHSSGNTGVEGRMAVFGDLAVAEGRLVVEAGSVGDGLLAVGDSVSVAAGAQLATSSTTPMKVGTEVRGDVPSAVAHDRDAVARYADLASRVTAGSRCFAAAPTTGTVLIDTDSGSVRFVGDGVSGVQVFRVDADLRGAAGFQGIPADATVLVNVVGGPSRTIAITGTPSHGESILWNIADARSVHVDGVQLPGSLLVGAEGSTTTIGAADVAGQLLTVGDLSIGGATLHGRRFGGHSLPECEAGARPAESVPPSPAAGPAERPVEPSSLDAPPTASPVQIDLPPTD